MQILKRFYSSPFKVYTTFIILLGLGIYSYVTIPVALFPNSTKPFVQMRVPYGQMTSESFVRSYGKDLERQLYNITAPGCKADEVRSDYFLSNARYELYFSWGDDGRTCLKEVRQVLSTFQAYWSEEVRNQSHAWLSAKNSGFIFASFSSSKRSSAETAKILEKVLQPKLNLVKEADEPQIFDPNSKQILIEVDPTRLATFRILPRELFRKVQESLRSYSSGVLHQGSNNIAIELPAQAASVSELGDIT